MANKNRPTFTIYRGPHETRVTLQGHRGGVRHTYGWFTFPNEQGKQGLESAFSALLPLIKLTPRPVGRVKAE